MLIGVVGKPNVGKSTFFSAATMHEVQIANYPFTTVEPNRGTTFVRTKCIHNELGKECQPMNSQCMKGERLIPFQLLDVAGLVPGAWQGKGLGNQFLNDLMTAKALIHVVDMSGGTDLEGNPVEKGSHDPAEDVRFLETEISQWIKSILEKNWDKLSNKADAEGKGLDALSDQLSGLGISQNDIATCLKEFSGKLKEWSEDDRLKFSEKIRKISKPILIAANKMDVEGAMKNLERLKKEFPNYKFVSCCAEAELALKKADKAGLIKYLSGDREFSELKELDEKQKKGLEFIKKNVLEKFSGTGIQEAINQTVFELLDLITIYPVQDVNKWISGKGHILPDTYLMKKNSGPKDLAREIHTDFVKKYIGAVNCRTGQRISEEYKLKENDVIKILLKN